VAVRLALSRVASHMANDEPFARAMAHELEDAWNYPSVQAKSIISEATHLFLDGLDECGVQTGSVLDAVRTYSVTKPTLRIVVTARPMDFENLPGARTAVLLPLERHDLRRYATKLAPELVSNQDESRAVVDRFCALLDAQKLDLTPLNVTILLSVARDSRVDAARLTNVQLYDHLVSGLAARSVQDRAVPNVPFGQAREVLRCVAWKLTEDLGATYEVILDAAATLPSIRGSDGSNIQAAERAIEFWRGMAVLQDVPGSSLPRLEFGHSTFREHSAAHHFISLPANRRRDLIATESFLARTGGLLDFAIELDATVVEDVRHALDLGELGAFKLLARLALSGTAIHDDILHALAASAPVHLRSPIPSKAAEAALAIAPLARRAADAFAAAAVAVHAKSSWAELGALLVRVSAGDAFVAPAELLEALDRYMFDGPSTVTAERNPRTESVLLGELIVPALGVLHRNCKDAEVRPLIEKVLSTGRMSARTHDALVAAVTDWGYGDIAQRDAAKLTLGANHLSRLHRQTHDEWEGDWEFLVLLQKLVGSSRSNEDDDIAVMELDKLVGALGFAEAIAGEWNAPLFKRGGFPLHEVLQGVIDAYGLERTRLAHGTQVALSIVVPSTGPDATTFYYRGLIARRADSPASPDWKAGAAARQVEPLVKALRYGSAIAANAIHLLFYHPNRDAVRLTLEKELLRDPHEALVFYCAQLAETMFGERTVSLFLGILEHRLNGITAGLFSVVRRLDESNPDVRRSIGRGLESVDGEVVIAAAHAAKEFATIAPDLDEMLLQGLEKWIAWSVEHPTPLEEREHGLVEPGTTLHGKSVSKELLMAATSRKIVGEAQLVEHMRYQFLAEEAARALVADGSTSTEGLSRLVEQVATDQLPPVVVQIVLELPASKLAPIADSLELLHTHPSPVVRRIVLLSLRYATWLDENRRKGIFELHLGDDDPALRNIAAKGVSPGPMSPFERQMERLGMS
jgi:hypothetical protein